YPLLAIHIVVEEVRGEVLRQIGGKKNRDRHRQPQNRRQFSAANAAENSCGRRCADNPALRNGSWPRHRKGVLRQLQVHKRKGIRKKRLCGLPFAAARRQAPGGLYGDCRPRSRTSANGSFGGFSYKKAPRSVEYES